MTLPGARIAGWDAGGSAALLRLGSLDVDHLSLRASFASPDLDPSWLGLRGNRYLDGEHALFVAGLQPIGVKVLAEEHLALERANGALLGDDLVAFFSVVQAFGSHGEHVLLDRKIDRARFDPREIEVQEDRVPPPIGIHGDRSNLNDSSEGLLGETVQIPERIEAHDHWVVTPWARTSVPHYPQAARPFQLGAIAQGGTVRGARSGP
jgi:hypothetical protein